MTGDHGHLLDAPVHRRGSVHETCFYRSEQELLGAIVPFLEEGRRNGEAMVVNVDERNVEPVRSCLDRPDEVLFISGPGRYGSPAAAIKRYSEIFDSMLSDGVRSIRVVGEVPGPGGAQPWEPWARYEAAFNRAFAHVPAWTICPYDLRSTPDHVVEDALSTHPFVVMPDGTHRRNERFQDPAAWIGRRPSPPPDPLERTAPALELRDPWPHEARQAIEPLAGHLPLVEKADLATSVSEIVANARAHGTPPTLVRAWSDGDRVVVTVHDRGSGPDDPFAGFIPPQRELGDGGLGLWIVHQLCNDVAMTRSDDGFCIRIVAGAALSA